MEYAAIASARMEEIEPSKEKSYTSNASRGGARSNSKNLKQQASDHIYYQLLNLARDRGDDTIVQPSFRKSLRKHFERLSTRYALEIFDGDPDNVLLHKRLLEQVQNDATNQPAVIIRTVEQIYEEDDPPSSGSVSSPGSGHSHLRPRPLRRHPRPSFGSSPNLPMLARPHSQASFNDGSSYEDDGEPADTGRRRMVSLGSSTRLDEDNEEPHMVTKVFQEVTIAGKDRLHKLSALSGAVCDVGLNVREAHVFTTSNGYRLDIFVADNIEAVDLEELTGALLKAMGEQMGDGTDNMMGVPEGKAGPEIDSLLLALGNYTDWEMDLSKLEVGPKLASGSFADLYKGVYCGQSVAVKVLRTESITQSSTVQSEFCQEVSILRKIRHKNVVQFIGVCTQAQCFYIVTEFMEGGSLYEFYRRRKGVRLSPAAVTKAGLDVARGMDYLHKNKIIHRDLKASNLLIDQNGVVKVADFGVSRIKDDKGIMTAETGTYRWMAPEIIEHRPYDTSVDVYSFGITLWELLTGSVPYSHLTPLQAAVGVVQKDLRPEIPETCPPELADIMKQCWEHNPALRPDFDQIIKCLVDLTKLYGEERLMETEEELSVGEQDKKEPKLIGRFARLFGGGHQKQSKK